MEIFTGSFNIFLIQPLANGLILFYKLLGSNLGTAIIGFTLFLRILLTPLTSPYMQSMKRMKEFEPQLNELKIKYKDDKTKLMQAQADFYKEKGINPASGCLPYLFQIIILIALFNVFTRALSAGSSIEDFNHLLYSPLKLGAGELLNTRFLYFDVTKPDVFKLPGVPFPIPGVIILLAALVQFLSAKMTSPIIQAEKKVAKTTPGGADDMSVAMQQSMGMTFPLFTIVLGISFPAGVTLYWLLFSGYQIVQQYFTSGWGGLAPWVNKFSKVVALQK
ncbi:membrane protein insertase YidC [Candidatus Woesebacteria bacterium]|nr:membrane protein insertase YidC [Candidatus Woesebacteria bacterium]